ncbi:MULTISPECIES: dTMP kinase [unclassified Pseudomonas]|uniref:dTMP kinase n=1 Tax=unclassified Pseudomonas TaxID=196821 RepID=UPI0020B8CAE2|nr:MULTISPECIES: dTMP kinase [unclassified Pseudomonas]MCP3789880.1 thymidylate kinase [Pseudomonas sp. N2-11]MDI3373063.1 dTMP kinase [Pseudomonas sp. V104_6]
MSRPLFIAMDGPKGTGKTTLLEALTQALRARGNKVVRLCEGNNDPQRAQTMTLVNQLARQPSPTVEWQVCERLAESRAWITRHVLPRQPGDSIVLIDRWYPSDAAFRRNVPFDQVLRLNIERGVQVPDLHIAVLTTAQTSWTRAASRRRGLGSTVIHTLEEQMESTQAFNHAAHEHGWLLCQNEGTVADAVDQLVEAVTPLLHA